MSAASAEAPSPRPGVGPFVVFGAVAGAAALGAIGEISYWVGVPALAAGTIGTTVGIAIAVVAFFAWGLSAPPNE